MQTNSCSSSFCLKGQDDAFTARRDSIFGNLPMVQLEASRTVVAETVAISANEEEETDNIASYKGEESMFKQPMPKLKRPSFRPRNHSFPTRSKQKIPDHKRNPQKWTKYSLASTSDITDKSNAAAAFAFLREIEKRKMKESGIQEEEDEKNEGAKVVFKKPKAKAEKVEETKTYRDGKLVMPAFEFGSKKNCRPRSKEKDAGTSKHQINQGTKLSHLEDVDDE